MQSGPANYLPNLTGVRGLAAVWVLALHAWQFAGAPALALPMLGIDFTPLFQCGYFGVDLFFVLSGFLLAMPFHRAALAGVPRPSLKRFWVHRCRRVLPAYWVQLLILAAAYLWLQRSEMVAPSNLFAHALLIQNLVPWPVALLNPVYWSMPVEWDFYVVLPLLAALVTRWRWPLALLFAVAFAIAFRLLCYRSLSDPAIAAFVGYGDIQQLPARLDQFVIGICAARIALARPLSATAANACLAAGTAAIVVMVYVAAPRGDFLVRIDAPYVFFHHSLTGAAFGLLILGAAGGTRAGRVLLANRTMTFLGLVSYSLYLWHYPLLHALGALANGANVQQLLLAPELVAIVFVAWMSYRFVELPFLASAAAPATRGPVAVRPQD